MSLCPQFEGNWFSNVGVPYVKETAKLIIRILQQIYEQQAVSYNIYYIKFVMNETAYRLHLVKFVVEIQRSEPYSHTNHHNGRRSSLYTG